MSHRSEVYKVMLSCPSDIPPEMIQAVDDAIDEFNHQYGESLNAFLLFKHWGQDMYPQSGGEPQELINKHLLEPADLLIAIFWTRLGTETRNYESGTVEEIERSLGNDRQVFLYVCKADVPRDMLATADTKAVDDYVHTEYGTRAIFGEFKDVEELRKKVRDHLHIHFLRMQSPKENEEKINASNNSKDVASQFGDQETLDRLKVWLKQREGDAAKNTYPIKLDDCGYLLIDIVPSSSLGIFPDLISRPPTYGRMEIPLYPISRSKTYDVIPNDEGIAVFNIRRQGWQDPPVLSSAAFLFDTGIIEYCDVFLLNDEHMISIGQKVSVTWEAAEQLIYDAIMRAYEVLSKLEVKPPWAISISICKANDYVIYTERRPVVRQDLLSITPVFWNGQTDFENAALESVQRMERRLGLPGLLRNPSLIKKDFRENNI